MQMKNEPGISICIPSYNGEKYLRECLDSCLNQTLHAKEILIVDDGSNDQTAEMCDPYHVIGARRNRRCHLYKSRVQKIHTTYLGWE